LSSEEYASIVESIKAAKEALDRSSQTIAQQSRDLTQRSILCGTLGIVATLELGYIILKK
jgi:hypothetical protein